MTCQISFSINY